MSRLDALEKEKEAGGFEKGFLAAGDSGPGPGCGSAPGPGPSGGSTTASDASRPNEKEPFSALLRVSLARLAIVHAARVKYERVVSPEALRVLDAAARDAEEQPSPKRAEAWSLAAVAKRWVATLGASPAAVAALDHCAVEARAERGFVTREGRDGIDGGRRCDAGDVFAAALGGRAGRVPTKRI